MLPVLRIPIFEKRIEMNDKKVHHPLLISLDYLIIKLPQKRLLIFILKKILSYKWKIKVDFYVDSLVWK